MGRSGLVHRHDNPKPRFQQDRTIEESGARIVRFPDVPLHRVAGAALQSKHTPISAGTRASFGGKPRIQRSPGRALPYGVGAPVGERPPAGIGQEAFPPDTLPYSMLRLGLLLLAVPGCATHEPAIEERLAAALDLPGPAGTERSIWIGNASTPIHTEAAHVPRPAASSIKVAYLIELFAELGDALDQPVPNAAAVVGDPKHPAIAHFDAEVRREIRDRLEPADARTVGRHMIRGTGVSNAVYNAAANLTTAFLGGPPALTGRIHARRRDFAGIHSRRYMLAARDRTGDNTATAASLAAVLGGIARGDLPGVPPGIHREMRDVLFLEETPGGRHYYKGGALDSFPVTRVLSGYFERPGEPPGRELVYVFMGELAETGDPADTGRRLQEYLQALRAAALPIVRAGMSP